MAVEAAGEVLGGARELRVLVGGRVAGLLVEVAALVLAPGHGFEGAVVCDLEPVGIFEQGEGEFRDNRVGADSLRVHELIEEDGFFPV